MKNLIPSNRPPFDQWFNNKTNLDIISDWDKIKSKLKENNAKQQYPAICSVCEKQIIDPFAPDGVRPVYCLEHRPKRK